MFFFRCFRSGDFGSNGTQNATGKQFQVSFHLVKILRSHRLKDCASLFVVGIFFRCTRSYFMAIQISPDSQKKDGRKPTAC